MSSLSGGMNSSLSGGMNESLSDGMNGSLSGGMNSSLSGGMNSSLSGGMNSSLSGGMNSSLSGGMNSSLSGGMNIRQIKYTMCGTIFYNLSYDVKSWEVLQQPIKLRFLNAPQLRCSPIKISYAKWSHLKRTIPKECHAFYVNLKHLPNPNGKEKMQEVFFVCIPFIYATAKVRVVALFHYNITEVRR